MPAVGLWLAPVSAPERLASLWEELVPDAPFPRETMSGHDWFRVLARTDSAVLFAKHDVVGLLVRGDGAEWPPQPPGLLGHGRLAMEVEGRRVSFSDDGTTVSAHAPPGAVERLVFWDGPDELPILPRCLIYAIKLRYEHRVYRDSMPAVRERQLRVDRGLDELLDLHRRVEHELHPRADDLVDAQSRLTRAETEAAGLMITVTRLKELRRTVAIAMHNLENQRPDPALFSRDLELGRWILDQIDNDIEYCEAVRERAREAHGLTGLRLSQMAEAQASLQSRLTLLQTTLLGALLTGLAAIEALQIQVPLEEALHLPMVGFLMALALAVPPLAVHWFEPYGRFDLAGAALLGATLGWLLLRLAWRSSPAPVGLVTAVLGAVALLGAAVAVSRMATRRTG